MPRNVGQGEGRQEGLVEERGDSRSNCPKESWDHRTPSTWHCMLLWSREEPRGEETEGQVLPFPQYVPEQLSTKRSISARPGSPFRGLLCPRAPSTLSHQTQAQGEDGDC